MKLITILLSSALASLVYLILMYVWLNTLFPIKILEMFLSFYFSGAAMSLLIGMVVPMYSIIIYILINKLLKKKAEKL